jgi:hypothetical protein
VCEILPHLGFQCSVKTLNDTGFGLLVVSGKEVHVVFLKKEVREWLQSQDTYTLHKPTRRRFPRRQVVVYGIDHQWQADLGDLAKLVSFNKGCKYLLTCIDVLSRYAWVVPFEVNTTCLGLLSSWTFKYRVHDWTYSLRRSSLSSMDSIFSSKVSMTFTRCSTGGFGRP